MHGWNRVRSGLLTLVLVGGTTLLPVAAPATALARGQVFTVGVGNTPPTGHNFEYVDYFPRAGLSVSPSDVLDFHWNPAEVDGAHTVTFFPRGGGINPIPVPEPTLDEPGLEFNPAILLPTNPTCGGSSATPCVFDGSQPVNSGFIFNGNPTPPYFSDFYVQLDPKLLGGGAATSITYFCQIHPGMAGTLTLVADSAQASDQASVDAQAATQLADDNAGAFHAEAIANNDLVQRNPDGSATITMTAGTATDKVEVAEMLPTTVTIHPGDTVWWVTKTLKDPHTVTFPRGPGSESVDPLPVGCENQAGADTPPSANGPPCANPADFEVGLVPQPLGAAVISTPRTVATSGVIGSLKEFPSDRYAFTFPNAGAFDYMCRVHDHMVGLIVAQ